MKKEYLFIEDIAFESAVKDILGLSDEEEILLQDVRNIIKMDLSNLDITSLKGLEHFHRLSSLDISRNRIDDLLYLGNLKLDYLNVSYLERCKDFSVIAKIKTLKKLDLSGNWVKSFDFLENLPDLEILYLNDMGFDDFSELPAMKNLRKLYLEDNELEDIENPPYLPVIKEIYLARNKLRHIYGIEKLKTLEKIRISYNQIENINALKYFERLKKLYMSYNQIVDLSPLENMEITEKLAIAGNYIVDTKPIEHLINSSLDIFGLDELGIIRPTEEQIRIINYTFDDNDLLKVNAYAGTGKTTTAVKFIENYHMNGNVKILYLTFNKSVKEDIERKIPENFKDVVEVRTAHSLAWKYLMSGKNFRRIKTLNLNTNLIKDYLYFDKEDKKSALQDARLIEEFIKYYLNSEYSYTARDIKKAFEEFFKYDERLLLKDEKDINDLITGAVKILVYLFKEYVSNYNILHDFYLKLFHLTLRNHISKLNNLYQLVIFDEAQDASMVMYDIVKKMSCKKLFIGDAHQEIYSFRHAVNILEKIEGNIDNLELTNSFRFGDKIADLANKILALKGVKTQIKGRGNDNILFYDTGNGMVTPKNKFTVISRTNIPLFKYAHEAVKSGKKIYFEGGFDTYPFAGQKAKSIFYLIKKEYGKIKNTFVRQFNSIWKLKKYSFEIQDFQLYNLIELIESYGNDFYSVFNLIKENLSESKYDADIVFTTVHKSKGVEYERVMLLDDFKVEPFRSNNDYEEVNMFYVAVTRAKNILFLPKIYEGFLDIDIDNTVNAVNNDLIDKEHKDGIKVSVNLMELTEFEKLLNRYYNLPLSKEASFDEQKLEIAKKMLKFGISLKNVASTVNIPLEILEKLLK